MNNILTPSRMILNQLRLEGRPVSIEQVTMLLSDMGIDWTGLPFTFTDVVEMIVAKGIREEEARDA